MKPIAYFEDLGDRLVVVNANTTKRNALSPRLYEVIHEALELAGREPRITSVVLRGEGGFFCAGGDLGLIAERKKASRDERREKIDELHDVTRAIVACPKPVIAAVEGGAAGAGVSIAFACDMIVAQDDALFTVAYVKAGLVPDGGLTSLMAAGLPRATLMRMALLGEAVPAERLYALGAVSQLAPKGEVMTAVEALAAALAKGASATQGVIKGLVSAAYNTPLAEQLDAERDAMADAFATPEANEGISAFLEKRVPDFAKLRGKP